MGDAAETVPPGMTRRKPRTALAVGAGLVLGAAGAAAAVLATRPTFRSVGLVEVAPPFASFDAETSPDAVAGSVESQAALATTPRIADLAMQSAEWRKLGRGVGDEAVARFRRSLRVRPLAGSRLLEFSFEDADRDAVSVGVNAIIKAYCDVHAERDAAPRELIEALERQRTVSEAVVREYRTTILEVTDGLGADALAARAKAAVDEWNRVESALVEFDLTNPEGSGDAAGGRSEAEIARMDTETAALVSSKESAETHLRALVEDQKLGDVHPAVIAARADLAACVRKVSERVSALRAAVAGTAEERRLARARLVTMRDRLAEESRRLHSKLATVSTVADEERRRIQRLDAVRSRLEQIHDEAPKTRASAVMSWGERPLEPASDDRTLHAALAAAGGFVLGAGAVSLLVRRPG